MIYIISFGSFWQDMDVGEYPGVKDNWMTIISSQGTCLLSLDISGSEVTDSGFSLLRDCPNLQSLFFNYCDNLSDNGINYLSGTILPTFEHVLLHFLQFCSHVNMCFAAFFFDCVFANNSFWTLSGTYFPFSSFLPSLMPDRKISLSFYPDMYFLHFLYHMHFPCSLMTSNLLMKIYFSMFCKAQCDIWFCHFFLCLLSISFYLTNLIWFPFSQDFQIWNLWVLRKAVLLLQKVWKPLPT